MLQYDAVLATTGVIRDTSREKKYQELGLKYLQSMKLCSFYKVQVIYGGKTKRCLAKYVFSAPFNTTFTYLILAEYCIFYHI